jgi:pyruvate/2-oxoglutarate dehydrogenase complex dihydrolipoamide dehydrogenase (E3) component
MKKYPLVVIGAGAGGLVVAIGGAKGGKQVLLIERGLYGGDCTNYGCVPSKALIASSHIAHHIQTASEYGIELNSDEFTSKDALERTRRIILSIRDEEEPEILEKHGVETLSGEASFIDSHTLEVTLADGSKERIQAKTIVLATGSSPVPLAIPGSETVDFLTNESIFDLEEVPEHLIILGGGPIGCELGQAFLRLGSKLSLVQLPEHLMAREEPEAQKAMEEVFRKESMELYLNHKTTLIENCNPGLCIHVEDKNTAKTTTIKGSHILFAVGRKPSLSSLNLEAAGVEYSRKGIQVDAYGRSSQKHIWAVGDAVGRAPFTHVAENEGRSVLFNLLNPLSFIFKKKIDSAQAVPRVTYTDPEVASIGIREEEALQLYGEKKIATYHLPFKFVDRAITTGRTEGFVKVVTKKWSSKILGATIVGPRAGEMLPEIALAMQHNIPLRKLASLIHAYPTYGQGIRKTADKWLTETLLSLVKKK